MKYLVVIKKYWFLAGLASLMMITLADSSGMLASMGRWLKQHHGPDLVIVLIFLFSGFSLSTGQLKEGLTDVGGILLASLVIFVIAPLAAVLFGLLPMDTGILIGLFLVAVMPSTLSSGVVMTDAAGGNAAHALVTTIVSNSASVFTIPFALSFLLLTIGESAAVTIDKAAIMIKIAFLVVLPLALGMLAKSGFSGLYQRIGPKLSIVNQCLILTIVWIGLSQTRDMLVGSGATAVDPATTVVFPFDVYWHDGLLTLDAAGGLRLDVMNVSIAFNAFRMASRLDDTGTAGDAPQVHVTTICSEIQFYGPFLQMLGFCNPQTDVLDVFGTALLRPHDDGVQSAPVGAGDLTVEVTDDAIVASLMGSTVSPDQHRVALLAVDAATGSPLYLDYAATDIEVDGGGLLVGISLDTSAVDLPDALRVYLMVDTYPAAMASVGG